MATRASWKGFIRLGALSCAVALHAAVSSSERVNLHMANRRTGNRLNRVFVDQETGRPVPREDQVKGYQKEPGSYVMLEPEEVAAVVPDSDKVLDVGDFIPCDQVDRVYLDRPYYLVPDGTAAEPVYAVLRDGMRRSGTAALARTVLFRRVRTMLIRPLDDGLLAHTLSFDYEVRPAAKALGGIPAFKVTDEMLDLARHIIETKAGSFDPATVDDRYDTALAELIQAKIAGKPLPKAPSRKPAKVLDLMEALRQSAQSRPGTGGANKTKAAPRRKAS
ncbi:Ku protein [Zavarzinia sp. CC-PAN008]|uniref:non-homologous end joining protein Ku n=1 Tax=Zavarzinia sp. CC-PAN008 TaxID=3243332 RepID=UPI003F7420E5